VVRPSVETVVGAGFWLVTVDGPQPGLVDVRFDMQY
jgi:hypothetical protein